MSHEVFSPELEFGSGCDIAIVEHERKVITLAEIKESRLDRRHVLKAIKQLNESEERLRERYPGYIFKKVLVRDKKGRCPTFSRIPPLLEKDHVDYMTTANSEKARRFRNIHRKLTRKARKS